MSKVHKEESLTKATSEETKQPKFKGCRIIRCGPNDYQELEVFNPTNITNKALIYEVLVDNKEKRKMYFDIDLKNVEEKDYEQKRANIICEFTSTLCKLFKLDYTKLKIADSTRREANGKYKISLRVILQAYVNNMDEAKEVATFFQKKYNYVDLKPYSTGQQKIRMMNKEKIIDDNRVDAGPLIPYIYDNDNGLNLAKTQEEILNEGINYHKWIISYTEGLPPLDMEIVRKVTTTNPVEQKITEVKNNNNMIVEDEKDYNAFYDVIETLLIPPNNKEELARIPAEYATDRNKWFVIIQYLGKMYNRTKDERYKALAKKFSFRSTEENIGGIGKEFYEADTPAEISHLFKIAEEHYYSKDDRRMKDLRAMKRLVGEKVNDGNKKNNKNNNIMDDLREQINIIKQDFTFEHKYYDVDRLTLDKTNLRECVQFMVGCVIFSDKESKWYYRCMNKANLEIKGLHAFPFQERTQRLKYIGSSGCVNFDVIFENYILSEPEFEPYYVQKQTVFIPYLLKNLEEEKKSDKNNTFTPYTYDDPDIDITGIEENNPVLDHFKALLGPDLLPVMCEDGIVRKIGDVDKNTPRYKYYEDRKMDPLCVYNYALDAFAYYVQNCNQNSGVWIVLGGASGAGKTSFCDFGRYLFAPYSMQDNGAITIIDHFNAHTEKITYYVCNETGEYGFEKREKQRLKSTITESTRDIVVKGKEPERIPNIVNGIIVSNNLKSIQYDSETKRRLAFFEVSNNRVNDPVGNTLRYHEYYVKYQQAIRDPIFMKKMFKWLSLRDISKFIPAVYPITAVAESVLKSNKESQIEHLEWLCEEYHTLKENGARKHEEHEILDMFNSAEDHITKEEYIYVKKNILYQSYKKYCHQSSYVSKVYKNWFAAVENIGIKESVRKIDKRDTRMIVINWDEIKKNLTHV